MEISHSLFHPVYAVVQFICVVLCYYTRMFEVGTLAFELRRVSQHSLSVTLHFVAGVLNAAAFYHSPFVIGIIIIIGVHVILQPLFYWISGADSQSVSRRHGPMMFQFAVDAAYALFYTVVSQRGSSSDYDAPFTYTGTQVAALIVTTLSQLYALALLSHNSHQSAAEEVSRTTSLNIRSHHKEPVFTEKTADSPTVEFRGLYTGFTVLFVVFRISVLSFGLSRIVSQQNECSRLVGSSAIWTAAVPPLGKRIYFNDGFFSQTSCNFAIITSIDASSLNIGEIPEGIAHLSALINFTIAGNPIRQLPDFLPKALPSLKHLDISSCHVTSLSAAVSSWSTLDSFVATGNPISISVDLGSFNLSVFPPMLMFLRSTLQTLSLDNNRFTAMPVQILEFSELRSLDMSANLLKTINPPGSTSFDSLFPQRLTKLVEYVRIVFVTELQFT